jgi:hypothetical protein
MANNKFARTMNRTRGDKALINPHATNAATSKRDNWQKEMMSSLVHDDMISQEVLEDSAGYLVSSRHPERVRVFYCNERCF